MAKLSKSEMFKKVKEYLKEDTSDEAISLLEDLTDTLSEDNEDKDKIIEDLKKEKEELDKSWRQRYIDRFEGKVTDAPKDNDPEKQGGDTTDVDDEEPDDEAEDEDLTYEDLLTEDDSKGE